MTALDFNIWKVGPDNDALYSWAVSDIAKFVIKTWEQAASLVAPQTKVMAENTAHLIRKPIDTTFTGKNWWKLALTIPSIWADIIMKAMRLPFATLDNALTYVVNNNLERTVWITKAYTTGLVSNLISQKWKSRFKFVRWVGIGVEWVGDLLGSLVKLPTWALAKGTSIVDKFLAKGTKTTDSWVKWLRVSDTEFISVNNWDGITNTWSTPEAANDNQAPLKAAA